MNCSSNCNDCMQHSLTSSEKCSRIMSAIFSLIPLAVKMASGRDFVSKHKRQIFSTILSNFYYIFYNEELNICFLLIHRRFIASKCQMREMSNAHNAFVVNTYNAYRRVSFVKRSIQRSQFICDFLVALSFGRHSIRLDASL